jgi:hypothetical protein
MTDAGDSPVARGAHTEGKVAGGLTPEPPPKTAPPDLGRTGEPGLEPEDPISWVLGGVLEGPVKGALSTLGEKMIEKLDDQPNAGPTDADLTPVLSVPPSPDDDGEPDTATAKDSDSTSASDSTGIGDGDGGDSAAGDDADGSADGGGGCFVAGTPVHTDGGMIAIEDVALDAKLVSCDVASGVAAVGTVTRRFEATSAEVVTVVFAGEALRCTARHRFFTTSGWLAAGKLSPGTEVRCLDGAARAVVAVSVEQAEVAVFNLRVDWQHTYYVGTAGYLVHNEKDQDNGDATGDGIPDGSVGDKV